MRASSLMGLRSLSLLWLIPLASVGLAVAGCPADPPPPKAPEVREIARPQPPPPEPLPSYVLADPDAQSRGTTIPLDDGAIGLLSESTRIWSKGATIRVARDLAPGPLSAVEKIPTWLGGGFLFRSGTMLYRAEAFDGPLAPLISAPSSIHRIAYGPRGALLRGGGGQRWVIEIPSGNPASIAPVGLLDIASLGDGRAAALTEGGRVSVTTDKGERWVDRTAQLGGAPASVSVVGGDLWIGDETGRGYKVEASGALKEFDAVPSAPKVTIRPRDPAWHGTEAPLVAAVRRGARLDDASALVVQGGDVVRVDLRSGAIKIVSAGRLPTDLPCEVIRAGDDLLAVCATARKPSLVASGLLSEKGPHTEKTFPNDGPFTANDDGSLAFGGSCDGVRMRLSVCVRDRHGEWQEHDVEPIPDAGVDAGPSATPNKNAPDAGDPPPNREDVTRWIPRADGHAVALVAGKVPGTFDPSTGVVRAFRKGEDERRIGSDLQRAIAALSGSRATIVDRTWTVTEGGVLHGWMDNGQAVTISPAGEVERSVFTFPRVATSGPFAFGFDRDGRAFQTTDRGESWVEVGAPLIGPSSSKHRALGPNRCSPVGCDLGAWARLGWEPTIPASEPEPPPPVARPPAFTHRTARELICVGAGEERQSALPPTSGSPEDFGLGVRRVPISDGSRAETIAYKRRFFARTLVNPPQGNGNADSDRPALALVHGYYAAFSEPSDPRAPFDGIHVLGPQHDGGSFKRQIDFLEAFDPAGAIRSQSFTLRDIAPITKPTGMPLGRLFASEGPEVDGLCAVLPLDPAGPSGLVFTFPSEAGQLVGTISGGASPHLAIAGLRGTPDPGVVIGAAEVASKELVALAVLGDGALELFKITPGGLSLLDHLAAPPSSDFSPANPDALAVGPQGALAVIRTPSGEEPPSLGDPALLLPLGGGAPTVLAPWSTLVSADDPACRGDASGYRAIIHTSSSWVRVRGASVARELSMAMSARVRWGASRICLEAIEVPESIRPLRGGDELETAIVARFVGTPSAGRVALSPGSELRQPMSCTLAPP